jgi:hypothetical protein
MPSKRNRKKSRGHGPKAQQQPKRQTPNTPLHQRCQRWLGLIRINLKRRNGRRNLHQCKGMIEKALAENPAAVFQENSDGKTPLMILFEIKHPIPNLELNEEHQSVVSLLTNEIHRQTLMQSNDNPIITINPDGSISNKLPTAGDTVYTLEAMRTHTIPLPDALARFAPYLGNINQLYSETNQRHSYEIEINYTDTDRKGLLLSQILCNHHFRQQNKTHTKVNVPISPDDFSTLIQALEEYQQAISELEQLDKSAATLFPQNHAAQGASAATDPNDGEDKPPPSPAQCVDTKVKTSSSPLSGVRKSLG